MQDYNGARLVSTVDSTDEHAIVLVPREEWEQVKRQVSAVHGAFLGLVSAMGRMGENPMMKVMMRQFGVDPDTFAKEVNTFMEQSEH